MANKNVISKELIKEYSTEYFHGDTELPWGDGAFTVKYNISASDMRDFVNAVVRSCFDEETGEYQPEYMDFMTRVCIATFYAGVELPADINDGYDILYGTCLIDNIVELINTRQLDEICRAIKSKVSYVTNTGITATVRRVNDIASSIENLQKVFEDMMNGVSKEDLANVVKAINNGKIDESKIVKEVVKKTAPKKAVTAKKKNAEATKE